MLSIVLTNSVLTKSLSMGIAASIMLNLLTDLSTGALSGLVAGLVIGAIIVPLMQVPDALGRALLVGALFGLGMIGYQLVRIIAVTGGSMGSILDALDGPVVGSMILNAILYIVYAILAGALIGVFTTVPGMAIKGGLVGMLLGAVLGAGLYWLLRYLGINMDLTLFRLLAGFLILGVLTAITGKE